METHSFRFLLVDDLQLLRDVESRGREGLERPLGLVDHGRVAHRLAVRVKVDFLHVRLEVGNGGGELGVAATEGLQRRNGLGPELAGEASPVDFGRCRAGDGHLGQDGDGLWSVGERVSRRGALSSEFR